MPAEYILAFIVGVCVGSFSNVLIYRIPREISFVYGTSMCPHCSERIRPYDLVPIFSYAVLGGKCRRCGSRISIRYPIIELIVGILAVLAVWAHGLTPAALVCFFIMAALAVISAIDEEHMIIPDGLVICLAALSLTYAVMRGNDISILSRAAGFFVLSVPMLALTFLRKDAFGGGDIKLIAVCGFLLGLRLILLAGFIAVVLGGCKGLYVLRKDRSTAHIAFGQYICIGVITALLFGGTILRWYFNFLAY